HLPQPAILIAAQTLHLGRWTEDTENPLATIGGGWVPLLDLVGVRHQTQQQTRAEDIGVARISHVAGSSTDNHTRPDLIFVPTPPKGVLEGFESAGNTGRHK